MRGYAVIIPAAYFIKGAVVVEIPVAPVSRHTAMNSSEQRGGIDQSIE
jgi:hypothetical protein